MVILLSKAMFDQLMCCIVLLRCWYTVHQTPECVAAPLCGAGQSVRHHMLTSYMQAILSIVLAQFTGLGYLDGMEGVIRLAQASPYIKVGISTPVFVLHGTLHKSLCAPKWCQSLAGQVGIQRRHKLVIVTQYQQDHLKTLQVVATCLSGCSLTLCQTACPS